MTFFSLIKEIKEVFQIFDLGKNINQKVTIVERDL